MMRQEFSSTGAVAAFSSTTVCDRCRKAERLVLHGVRQEGHLMKVCSTCVLQLHPQFFCPTCFTVYIPSQPRSFQKDVVSCVDCHSNSHTQCVGHTPPNPYRCPLCVSPDSDIFTFRKVPNADGKSGSSDHCRVIDKSAARILFAASRIAATSMSAAAASARDNAEKKVKEAAFSRKRAREALEHVSYMAAAEERMRRNEVLLVQRGIMGGIGSNSVVVRNQVENMDNVDKPSEVVAALNKELAEVQFPNNIVHMDVEDDGLSVAPDSLTGLPIVQNHEDSHENGMAEDIAEFDIANDQEVSINIIGVGSLPAQEEQDQQNRLILAAEQNNVNLSTV
ncbi:unnamed protein product [Cuscuta campestris]|uniref:Uncharacterized protein n=2 Tax=Cuscuta sect. Cleistogrammica TaxID=1824901 RepID=A0A484M8C4_9ASTE|nr:hypothetical protein DM860_007493 [Cuscuta australis]VFQ84877.1 unnamed protein product [Cuscuta campestris]